jgi:hypothetical protein
MIQIPVLTIVSGLLTISVRLSGLMLFAPFFGSVAIPSRVKAILVLALTLLLFPTVGQSIGAHPLATWPLMVFMEFMIGVGMGIATNVVFEAVQMAGQVLGVQMGYSLVNILDPQTQVDTTVMALFYQSIVMLLFLRMDVHYWLLRAICNSFFTCLPGIHPPQQHVYHGRAQNRRPDLRTGHPDRGARAIRHAGRGHRPRSARQSLATAPTHASWSSSQKPSRPPHPDRNPQILARPVPSIVYGIPGERRTHSSPGTIRDHG